MFTLGNLVVPFRSECVVIVAMLLGFPVHGSFQCRHCSWNLIDCKNTFWTCRLADNVQ